MNRTLTCIICPRGCTVTVTGEQDALQFQGNACLRGKEYARQECIAPVRTVTATVRVSNRHNTMAAVKTQQPVAKERMMELMQLLRSTSVQAPLHIGDVVLEDALGTRVLITKEVK